MRAGSVQIRITSGSVEINGLHLSNGTLGAGSISVGYSFAQDTLCAATVLAPTLPVQNSSTAGVGFGRSSTASIGAAHPECIGAGGDIHVTLAQSTVLRFEQPSRIYLPVLFLIVVPKSPVCMTCVVHPFRRPLLFCGRKCVVDIRE